MKQFYLAVTVAQDRNYSIFKEKQKAPEIGYYAYVVKVSENDNLKSALTTIGGLVHANIMPSKKAAAAVVNTWNNSYKANGTYLFSDPAF